ncbi:hypothetical protein VHEMI07473 [[Torrubiella] hemipterigena]|uniref:Uncharacterized protein n=1 Tax=[Torrubiella] hemipterigena TaxID=1531966 RepID=A0A0A1T3N0_9HYPO|nr:hypothetical protein VHEMI07473 [[Torrubiella] hemipterigena]
MVNMNFHKRLSNSDSVNSVTSLLSSTPSTTSSFASFFSTTPSERRRDTLRIGLVRRLSNIKTRVRDEWKKGQGKDVVVNAFSQQTTNARHSGLFMTI